MNIEQVKKLLNEKQILTFSTKKSLEQVKDQGENFYKLRFKNEKWEFLFIQQERSDEKETVLKRFDNESNACKYYFLFELNTYFFYQYVYKFELNNKDINIGEPNCTISDLKSAFTRLNIDEKYYSFNEAKKEHSIFLDMQNNKESRVKFIGDYKKEIFETPILENWLAYYAMYKFVYYLYLLDKECELLLNK
ncbi:hypothetical protein [Pseudogracilibacillus sp. SO30301A]|uniref:hypothetical protein n=1 Tax=Pseudogracilibacillus sp. SO30301A TaxID=3098291 RepID=UPI00300E4E85